MYKCCKCNHSIEWWKAVASSSTFPCKCPACFLEQKAKDFSSRKDFYIGVFAISLLFFCGHVLKLGAYPSEWPYVIGVVLSVCLLIYRDQQRVLKGVLVPNIAEEKTKNRKALAIIGPIIILWLAYKWL